MAVIYWSDSVFSTENLISIEKIKNYDHFELVFDIEITLENDKKIVYRSDRDEHEIDGALDNISELWYNKKRVVKVDIGERIL